MEQRKELKLEEIKQMAKNNLELRATNESQGVKTNLGEEGKKDIEGFPRIVSVYRTI